VTGVVNSVAAVLTAVVITYGLLYVAALYVLGITVTRRAGVAVSAQECLLDADVDLDADLRGLHFYVLVPALDEEAVIGATIESLVREQAGVTVVVIDDGSADRTAEIVSSYGHTGRVHLVSRVTPNARQGKGQALNAGLALIRRQVEAAGTSPARAIVAVMDADGRLTPNATAPVAREFAEDPSVGGLQLVVRIRNPNTLLTSFQDMEFWAMAGIAQLGRATMGSVSMGGNGQFTRLSALDEVGVEPWSRSLTEDLDLSISLSIRGWKTTSTPWAYVTQQGVTNLRRLIRQRTRWFQGHMMVGRRLPALTMSRHLPTWRYLETSAYVCVPWLITLPWSVLQQYLLVQLLLGSGVPGTDTPTWWSRGAIAVLWYLVSFVPYMFCGLMYYRRVRAVPLWRAMMMAHLLTPWSYVANLAVWRALFRIIWRRDSWAKTIREPEAGAVPAAELPLPAPRRRASVRGR